MRFALLGALLCLALHAQVSPLRPITALPYTPSLDIPSMDRTADPCVNFYQYSCGTWIKNNPIPGDQPSWHVYAKLTTENQEFLWGILEEAAKPSATRTPVEKEIGDYFHACMDEPAIEKTGLRPIAQELAEIRNLKDIASIGAVLAREHRSTGSTALFGLGSNQDFADANRVIAFAGASGLGLPDRDYYTNTGAKDEEIRQKYLAFIAQMLQLLGDPAPQAASESKLVMQIETALAKATLTQVDRRDPHKLFHKVDLDRLQALVPSFPWSSYLAAIGLSGVNEFNVTEPDFFRELEKQLTLHPIADWKTYLRWHLVRAEAAYLPSRFQEASFDFNARYLRGLKEVPPRWKRCVQYVDRDLGEALGQDFVAKTFTPAAKQRTLVMTKEIELAMAQELDQLTWMSPATKQNALTKLHSIVNKIGYPDRWRDYSSIALSRTDFAADVMNAQTFESDRQLKKIGKPVERGEWGMTPPTVNAYYDPQMNDINFPAGVLQPPLFDVKMDDAPNYGNTGATIGHELTHGFDDEGRQFDAKGNLHDWWTPEDSKEFEDRAKCVSDQYATYTVVDDIKINSKLTLGEDLADLGGTWLAYIAWKHVTANQKLHPIDGFTPDQRYFIGMAQWACGSERPEIKRMNAITNPHSPLEYRINGVVSNIPEFGQAFGCKIGQPMMHEKPCKVW